MDRDRPDSRQRGLERAHAVTRARARQGGAATGWHRSPDWRLDPWEARTLATRLEASGWRAEYVHLTQGVALVEVRSLRVRWTPLVATLRSPADARAFLAQQEAAR